MAKKKTAEEIAEENVRTNEVGLFNFADAYLLCAKHAKQLVDNRPRQLRFPEPIHFLLFHAAELYVKSYLRQKGEDVAALVKLGHYYAPMCEKAATYGLNLPPEIYDRKADRAHVVMACGTGKTFVALWAVEALQPKTVLVLLPSLTLLQQTLEKWSRHNSWGRDFTYLCVCSDPTVTARDTNDPIRLDKTDLEFRVDTSPDEVRRFIERDAPGVKVVFSTYQSSPVVSQGVRGLAPFDVAIFDEAHKTTAPHFAHSLKEENIRIRKRLFFTATPRHYDIRHRDKEGDFRFTSMDNEAVYGPRAYTLTFGEAARGIICNYKVVISVVDGEEINDFAIKHGITLVEGDLIGAKWVANQIAVERAVEKAGAKRVITFHSRVSNAKEFSSDGTHGIGQFLPKFSAFHVNGDQKSSERKQIIQWFQVASEALITNARCLTEGIDVPAVDMVAFIDPRHSRVDIAQATGRAMRKPPGSGKEVGYVVVPLFRDRRSGETLEEALKRSEFDDVANVLNAMREQDEDLVQIIRELQEAKGRGEIFDPRRLSEKIEVLGPSVDLSNLQSSILAEIVDLIGVSWDEWYGRLALYKELTGHCLVPARYTTSDGHRLGQWVSVQRLSQHKLSDQRKARLDMLGFDWDPFASQWEEGFEHLQAYVKEYGHARVPYQYKSPDGYKLGLWMTNQRHRPNSLSSDRKARLDALGVDWDPFASQWEEGFEHLQAYVKEYGHARVPQQHKSPDRYKLGTWVESQRNRRDRLTSERKARLDMLGFDWDPIARQWEEGFEHLQAYVKEYGHARVPQQYKSPDRYKLGTWVNSQRHSRDKLTSERKARLDMLGLDWDPIARQWEEGFEHLQAYVKEYGHARVPQQHKSPDCYSLGTWVVRQRRSRDDLTSERKARMDMLGFDWDPHTTQWEEGFEHLQAYVKEYGHARVPHQYKSPDGYKLGKWVDNQRHRPNSVSPDRKARLDALGLEWGGNRKELQTVDPQATQDQTEGA
jgi:superfamily II DNA or RNA helicase